MASGFLMLVSFFTIIPIGKKIIYNEEILIKALNIYSLIGAVIGIILFFTDLFCKVLNIEFLRGLIITVVYILTTGGIHLDGTADTSDGIFSGRTKEKIFDIMSDSNIGSFGVISLILVIMSQYLLFSHIDGFTLIIIPILGKTAIIISSFKKKYAKNTKGMGTIFIESVNNQILLINILILLIFCFILPNRIILIICSLFSIVLSYFISKWIENKIGGMTGDTCGFINEVSQIIFMFIFLVAEGI